MTYNFQEIEKKWQKYWADNQTFKASNTSTKPKFYVLDMFPYPSGAGLHVGHPLGYIASDIYARYKRLKGYNVLHPMGYDSFGLPAEQYAIQTGQHPADTTKVNIEGGVDKDGNNIEGYRKQLDRIGFSFDWSRELRTSNPDFYKWTQWIFIKLFNAWYNKTTDKAELIDHLIAAFEAGGNVKVDAVCDDDTPTFTAHEWIRFTDAEREQILLKYRLAFLAEAEVNWCPALGTVLANDEIVNGVSERGGHTVIRKQLTQWSMRISAYAERLLQGLNDIDWPEPLKESQRNWIGKSIGASVKFNVNNHPETQIEVFTTRPDTIFGVSFMTLAPELDLVNQITTPEQKEAVNAYVEATSKRSERDRMADVKTITGVFTGAYAEHPFTKKPIPIWIGDYVLAGYGTGAVMAVPCGDQRDYDFAKHFNIDIPNIFKNVDISEEAYTEKENTVIANSDFLNDLDYKKANKKAIEELEAINQGEGKINYRLRDAVFSRQRYWGEPFPVYYKDDLPQMIAEEHLPIQLPEVEKYLPTESGEPPLGRADDWAWDTKNAKVVSKDLIDQKTVFPLELNTMPGWAGSSWYFNRYMDAKNTTSFAGQDALDYWKEVDLYIGGSEHATGHLLYSRFWQQFLFDLELVPVKEYAKKLINQGMILGESAFVYRLEDSNTFISHGLITDKNVQPIHVDVSMVNMENELDTEAFKNWRSEFKNAEFVLEEGVYKVGREVEKMSKSKFNVVNPDDICNEFGADSLRLYEMFLGPLEQAKPWNTMGITGVHGFLKKLWRLFYNNDTLKVEGIEPTKDNLKTLHNTIKKVEDDIEAFSFNTTVSTFMIAVNDLTAQKCTSKHVLEQLLILIAPYAPHITEELWQALGHNESISFAAFPKFDEKHVKETSKVYPISFNGKKRFELELSLDLSKAEVENEVINHEKTKAQLQGRTPKKVIVVPGKIVNIVG